MSSGIIHEKRIYMPRKAQEVLNPSRKARYRILYGGRGSGKSWALAHALIARSLSSKMRILCFREFQSSMKDSVHKLLSDRIIEMGLSSQFEIQRDAIFSCTGSEFIFKGVAQHTSELKSLENIAIAWGEEAEKLSADSLEIIIPTIRGTDSNGNESEIWLSFNPEDETSPVWKTFVVNQRPDCLSASLIFEDNDYFPDVLNRERLYCKKVDEEAYNHIWLGKPRKYGNALIFKGKFEVSDFETPYDAHLLFGMDFGFSTDACAVIRVFIKDNKLFIDNEAYGHGVEIEQMPTFMRSIPAIHEWQILADSARPDTINYLQKQGFMIEGAEKYKGSVEEGIEFMRAFERIIIHPRCTNTLTEFENYKFKVDKITGDVLPIPLDAWNHIIDAIRYALSKYIKQTATIFDVDY